MRSIPIVMRSMSPDGTIEVMVAATRDPYAGAPVGTVFSTGVPVMVVSRALDADWTWLSWDNPSDAMAQAAAEFAFYILGEGDEDAHQDYVAAIGSDDAADKLNAFSETFEGHSLLGFVEAVLERLDAHEKEKEKEG